MGTYIAKRSGATKFKVLEVVDYVGGKPKTRAVPLSAWAVLGFKPEMSLEKAREQASQLNKEQRFERRKEASIARRVEDIKLVKSVYLPEDVVLTFNKWLEDNKVRGDKKREKFYSHWEKAQEVIVELQVYPQDFFHNHRAILNYFVKRKYSISYARKVVAMLNLWGFHYASKRKTPFYPITRLDKTMSGEIEAQYLDSESYIGPSDPLTPEMLAAKKDKLKTEQYKYLFTTVWLGLRPSDIAGRQTKRKEFTIVYDESQKVDVLKIYQPKLRNKPHAAWKYIPLFLPEMKEAARYLSEELKAPTLKTMAMTFNGHVTLYGGRKGFVELMQERFQQEINNISNWLGHTNIYRTKVSYEDKSKVKFRRTS